MIEFATDAVIAKSFHFVILCLGHRDGFKYVAVSRISFVVTKHFTTSNDAHTSPSHFWWGMVTLNRGYCVWKEKLTMDKFIHCLDFLVSATFWSSRSRPRRPSIQKMISSYWTASWHKRNNNASHTFMFTQCTVVFIVVNDCMVEV